MLIFVKMQMENVTRFSLSKVTSLLPLKITGRNLEDVKIMDSNIKTLPWPGIFLHSARFVQITRNFFPDAKPRSISISLGEKISISHNLLNVGEVLKVEQYEHMVINCNRPNIDTILPATCSIPLFYEPKNSEIENSENLNSIKSAAESKTVDRSVTDGDKEVGILVTVAATADLVGLLWLAGGAAAALLLLLVFCFRRSHLQHSKPAALLRPHLASPPALQDLDTDTEYSESSRAHLGQDRLVSPQFVRVQVSNALLTFLLHNTKTAMPI